MPLIIEIKVVPSSGRQKCILDKANRVKCYVKNPPEKGLANKELIKFLAESLNLAQSAFMIIAGEAARTKKIKIDAAITLEQFLQKLQLQKHDQQMSLLKE
jgi:uncharacterized protein